MEPLRYPLNLVTDAVPVITLQPATTCLLLVDVHNPFWTGGCVEARARSYGILAEFSYYYGQAPVAMAAQASVLTAARHANMPVVYACLGYFPPHAPSAFQQAMGWRWDLASACGSFPSSLAPVTGEAVFAKPGWNALGCPDLEHLWQKKDIDTVILAGSLLEYGVRHSAMALADAGYRCLVLSDATTALSLQGRLHTQNELNHGLVKLRYVAEYMLLMERMEQQGQALV